MVAFITNAVILGAIMLYGCVGELVTEKSGHLNLGIPGIMCMGLTGGCIGSNAYMSGMAVADANWAVLVLITILSSVIFAAFGGLIYAFLTVTLRANQNISGLALTTFGGGFAMFFIKQFVGTDFTKVRTVLKSSFAFSEKLGLFGELLFSYDVFVYLSIIIAIIVALVLNKTRTGLNLRAVGENPATADAAGINVNLYKYGAIIIGSAIAGIGGSAYTLGSAGTGIFNSPNEILCYGWLAIALVIFTLWKPLLSILGSILFGGLLYLARGGIQSSGMGPYLMKLIPYVITVIVLIITSIIGKKENQPPASLGVNYFREDR